MEMVELNEKALEAACRAYEDATPSGYRYVPEGMAAAIRAYLSALPSSDHAGLVELLRGFEPYNHIQFGDDVSPVEKIPNMAWACLLIDEAATALSAGVKVKADNQVQKLTADNERLREALAFYADPKNYKGEFVPGGRSERGTYVLEHHINLVRKDAGNIARSALETQEVGE